MDDELIGGVDTHAAMHCAAIIDDRGRLLAVDEFAVCEAGYRKMLAWMRRHGRVGRVGIEGSGAYGAGLARFLHHEGIEVLGGPKARAATAAQLRQVGPD